jgi:hypothetical protein
VKRFTAIAVAVLSCLGHIGCTDDSKMKHCAGLYREYVHETFSNDPKATGTGAEWQYYCSEEPYESAR